jgi:hypothetical protein
MKLRKNIAISDSGFIFNPTTGDSFTTNAIGLEILALLREGHAPPEIVDTLSERYASEKTTIDKDVAEFLLTLRHHKMLLEEA